MSSLPAENYELLEVIGRGAFGTVRRIRRKSDGLILVRKEISYTRMEIKERKQLVAEFEILAQIKHPNVIQYFHRDHLKSDQMLHLYMEYCGNGDLAGFVRRCKERGSSIPESYIWTVCVQLVTALFLCHNGYNAPEPEDIFSTKKTGTSPAPLPHGRPLIKVLHRDLKPENIFVMEDNSIKIGDFGLAKLLQPGQNFAQTYAGTPNYMSPEIINGLPYTAKSDIWSAGCILYELCAQEVPFTAFSLPQLIHSISRGQYKPIPRHYSPRLAKIIDMCLRVDPDRRASAEELLGEETIQLFRREMQIVETGKLLRTKEEEIRRREEEAMRRDEEARRREGELRRKEAILQTRANEMERMYAESGQRLEQEIDSKLRAEWEIRAEVLIKQKVEMEVFTMTSQFESRLQKRLADEIQTRLEAEVQVRIASMGLVPRVDAVHSGSLNSSLNGSLNGSGVETGPPTPLRLRFPVLVPDSPADITMGSPSPQVGGGNGTISSHSSGQAIHQDPPPRMPLKLIAPSPGNFLFENQDRAFTPNWPTVLPTSLPASANGAPSRQPLKPNSALINVAAKWAVTTNANGSPTRVVGRARAGLQRAETTGGFPAAPPRLAAGFGIGGSGGSSDDIATVKAGLLGAESTKNRAKSLIQISQERIVAGKRGSYGPPAMWREEGGDMPSPFKKDREDSLNDHH